MGMRTIEILDGTHYMAAPFTTGQIVEFAFWEDDGLYRGAYVRGVVTTGQYSDDDPQTGEPRRFDVGEIAPSVWIGEDPRVWEWTEGSEH
jgi:hypothetical protein